MRMTVPDEAVEAAAMEYQDITICGDYPKWDDLTESGKKRRRDDIRAALEAAAPFIAAQAWDAAVQYADDQGCLLYHEAKGIKSHNPYRSEQ